MRFIISSSALLKNLQLVGGIISSNTVLPVLEDFLFDFNNNKLTIIGSDLETMIKVDIEVQTEVSDDSKDIASGRICVPSKILLEYLKNLPEQPIHFNINTSENSIEISSSTGKYKIGAEKSDEYPKAPQAEDTTNFQFPSAKLIDAVSKTIFAISNDTLRPAMTGVLFEFGEEEVTFVATDAQRLIKYTFNGLNIGQQSNIIVPRKPLQQLKNILPNDDSALNISFNNTHLFIHYANVYLTCRLIDATFPPYKAVIPAENPYSLVLNRADLIGTLRRISIFANKTTSQVVFDIIGNTVSLSAQDVDFSFEGNEQMTGQYNGEDMKIAFNAKLLIEMLNTLDGEEVEIELSMPSRAGIFRSVEKVDNEDLLMLLMPLLVGI